MTKINLQHTIYEGVLNDDYITECSDGSALLTYYTYATEWSNHIHEKAFSDIGKAMAWYRRKFHDRVFEQGKRWLKENDGEYYNISDTPEEFWSAMVYEYKVDVI